MKSSWMVRWDQLTKSNRRLCHGVVNNLSGGCALARGWGRISRTARSTLTTRTSMRCFGFSFKMPDKPFLVSRALSYLGHSRIVTQAQLYTVMHGEQVEPRPGHDPYLEHEHIADASSEGHARTAAQQDAIRHFGPLARGLIYSDHTEYPVGINARASGEIECGWHTEWILGHMVAGRFAGHQSQYRFVEITDRKVQV
jgi:hypothetical protein